MIPKTTTPLTKAIRTLEGQLIVISDVVAAAASAVDPTALPPKYAAIIVGAQHIALAVSRAAVKAKAAGLPLAAEYDVADFLAVPDAPEA